MELTVSVQRYHWGKVGKESRVARLAAKNDPDGVVVEPQGRYAELWIGTHPNGPSKLKSNGKLLVDHLKENPECLGDDRSKVASGDLPYLLKVLSVDTALSIQAHPDKVRAELLHKAQPTVYGDDNHKPELAVAITDFEALCGFRPADEIRQNLRQKCPELGQLCAVAATDGERDVSTCFRNLMEADKAKVGEALERARARIVSAAATRDRDESLFLRLTDQHPGDVGCFVTFFLNFVELRAGEAVFLGPNVPHAYLRGDCVECMARSDNTVRAGLTPKLVDVPTLCDMLDYTCVKRPDDVKFVPRVENETSWLYDPPSVQDFAVARIVLKQKSTTSCRLLPRTTASIVIVVQGEGSYRLLDDEQEEERVLGEGTVLFLPAKKTMVVMNKSSDRDLLAYQAFS